MLLTLIDRHPDFKIVIVHLLVPSGSYGHDGAPLHLGLSLATFCLWFL